LFLRSTISKCELQNYIEINANAAMNGMPLPEQNFRLLEQADN
jgi:hypothetical protein